MKNRMYFKVTIFVFAMLGFLSCIQAKNQPAGDNQLTLVCPASMHPLASSWAAMYQETHPGLSILVNDLQFNAEATPFKNANVLAIVSQDQMKQVNWEKNWSLTLARKIVVPITNLENPMLKTFNESGISSAQLAGLVQSGKIVQNTNQPDWADCIVYLDGDQVLQKAVGDFLQINPDDFSGKILANSKAVINAVQQNKRAIGFVFLNDLENTVDLNLPANIAWLPIDRNANGKLESLENIYANMGTFKRAVWVGKYPHSLVQTSYLLGSENAITPVQREFIHWALNQGQEQLNTLGYTALINAEIPYKLDKVYQNELLEEADASAQFAGLKAFVVLLAILIILGLTIDLLLFRRYRKADRRLAQITTTSIFNAETVQVPAGLFFDKTHTWAFMEQSGKVRIGLDDFIPSVTGNLTGIVMKKQGEEVKKGEVLFTISKQGKQLDIQAPVSGKIVANNPQLSKDASLINTSPYDKGWIYLIEPSNWLREIQFYLMADKFRLWLQAEYLRLKDFLAIVNKPTGQLQAQVVFQEGGEINKGVLGDLGPDIWEEFQHHFIYAV